MAFWGWLRNGVKRTCSWPAPIHESEKNFAQKQWTAPHLGPWMQIYCKLEDINWPYNKNVRNLLNIVPTTVFQMIILCMKSRSTFGRCSPRRSKVRSTLLSRLCLTARHQAWMKGKENPKLFNGIFEILRKPPRHSLIKFMKEVSLDGRPHAVLLLKTELMFN